MKIQLRQAFDSNAALQYLSGLRVKPAASMSIARVMRAVRPELEALESQRQAMLKEYGATLPAPNSSKYAFPDGREAEFTAEFNRCLDAEIELPIGKGLNFEEMGFESIEAAVVEVLWWLWAKTDGQ